jgi:hypothetical protein
VSDYINNKFIIIQESKKILRHQGRLRFQEQAASVFFDLVYFSIFADIAVKKMCLTYKISRKSSATGKAKQIQMEAATTRFLLGYFVGVVSFFKFVTFP